MAALVWDDAGNRFYETGVEKGVLYLIDGSGDYPLGVAWNGLVNVTESPSGAEASPLYADNLKYLNLISLEEIAATIEAYTFPDEFLECDGFAAPTGVPGSFFSQQGRTTFALSYQTKVGNDVDGDAHGYKIHLLYGCLASPSERAYQSINESPEAITFSWEVNTTPPVAAAGMNAGSLIVIDSRTADPTKLAAFELIVYGDTGDPRCPLPAEIVTLMTP